MKQTKIIIFINLLFTAFIVMLSYKATNNFEINKDILLENGAIIPYHSNFITLLISMFLHGSFFHLFVNMFSLHVFGKKVEPKLKKLYLPTYLGLGIILNLLGYFWYTSETFLIGASGAICIIWGIALFFDFKFGNKEIKKQNSFDISFFLGFTLLAEILNFPIANFIHIFGLLFGFLFAYIFVQLKKNNNLILIK